MPCLVYTHLGRSHKSHALMSLPRCRIIWCTEGNGTFVGDDVAQTRACPRDSSERLAMFQNCETSKTQFIWKSSFVRIHHSMSLGVLSVLIVFTLRYISLAPRLIDGWSQSCCYSHSLCQGPFGLHSWWLLGWDWSAERREMFERVGLRQGILQVEIKKTNTVYIFQSPILWTTVVTVVCVLSHAGKRLRPKS